MDQQNTAKNPANGASSPHELFALTDEQILEIEPEAAEATPSVEQPLLAVPGTRADAGAESQMEPSATSSSSIQKTQQNAQAGVPVLPEPPAWLAAQMKDPWSGEEARELWNGVLQARQESAAYRAAFATPEDARALKELYPGGVNEARATSERARLLEEIDRAYFGAPGGSAEQASAARADLAQRMLREDPAAFREMVFAGLRALEAAEKGSASAASASNLPRLAQVFAAISSAGPENQSSKSETRNPQSNSNQQSVSESNFDFRVSSHDGQSPDTSDQSLAAAYAAFEKSANEDLERSVGAAIERTLQNALPNLTRSNSRGREGAREGVPLQDRLSAAVRQDVEAALKGDRQLGEQIAQILSARSFDNETRAQVVRLIDDRARQLVPGAARRVIKDWTHTTLGAHRGNAARSGSASTRREVERVAAEGPASQGLPANQAGSGSSRAAQTRPSTDPHRNAARSDARRLDYRKLSDEQILDL